jgi:hypothetical protein
MNSELNDNDIYILLTLVFLILVKVIFSSIVYYSKLFHQLGLSNNVFDFIDSTKTLYSSFINLISMLVGIYFIFIKKSDNIYFILGFSVLIFKSIIHFMVTYKLYKGFNLTPENEQKLIKFRDIESPITNYVLMFLTLYILKVVFL